MMLDLDIRTENSLDNRSKEQMKFYDMGQPITPETDPESIYYYIAAACRASQELWSMITEYRAFERARNKATSKELLLFRVALETVREPLREVTDLRATGDEIAQSIKELETLKKNVA